MKKKRMLLVCMAALLIMGVSGCGNNSSSAATDTAQEATEVASGDAVESADGSGETKVAPVDKATEPTTEEATLAVQTKAPSDTNNKDNAAETKEEKKEKVTVKVTSGTEEKDVEMTRLESNLGFSISYAEDKFEYEYENSDYAQAASFIAKDYEANATMYIGVSEFYKEDTVESVRVQISEGLKESNVKVGEDQMDAVKVEGTSMAGQESIFYVVENGGKVWIFELDCDESSADEYLPLMEASVESISFAN
ncbi:MAG: hypothetical protein PUB22_01940 [Clostridiales bacterium]|nr:hypothetical protein [Clostridiales bacterium]